MNNIWWEKLLMEIGSFKNAYPIELWFPERLVIILTMWCVARVSPFSNFFIIQRKLRINLSDAFFF